MWPWTRRGLGTGTGPENVVWADEDVPYFPPLKPTPATVAPADLHQADLAVKALAAAQARVAELEKTLWAIRALEAEDYTPQEAAHAFERVINYADDALRVAPKGWGTCEDCGAAIEQDGSCGCEPGKGRK